MESSWPLPHKKGAPTCCLIVPSSSSSANHNPFENSAPTNTPLVRFYYGTDAGTLHALTYNTATKQPVSKQEQQQQQQSNFRGPIVDIQLLSQNSNQLLLLVDDQSPLDNSNNTGGNNVLYTCVVVNATNLQITTSSSLKTKVPKQKVSNILYHKHSHALYWTTDHTVSCSSSQSQNNRTFPALPGRLRHGALLVLWNGRVVICASNSAFFACSSQQSIVKLHTVSSSSQVHPVLVHELDDPSLTKKSSNHQMYHWRSVCLASGRECVVSDVCFQNETLTKSTRATIHCSSPILAISSGWSNILAILQSDGLVTLRNPACMGIVLQNIEVGTSPNDYSVWTRVLDQPSVVALSKTTAKQVSLAFDFGHDVADRLMRLSIDAFGVNGFPRQALAEAIHCSFTATSYLCGPELTIASKQLLKDYLEAILGLCDFESQAQSGWKLTITNTQAAVSHGTFEAAAERGRGENSTQSHSPSTLLAATALLCLVCSALPTPASNVAARAAKLCSETMGVVFRADVPKATSQVCFDIAEQLLRNAASKFSLGAGTAPLTKRSSTSSLILDFVEASIYLLRSCGQHQRAIDVAHERLQQSTQTDVRGFWSKIKYESYIATHLCEVWSASVEEGCALVLNSPSTHRLLESNPRLGLSVFTAMHPQNEEQWEELSPRDDPFAQPERVYQVLKLLKSVNPSVPIDKEPTNKENMVLPLESGRAVAVSYLQSAIGIATGKLHELDEGDEEQKNHQANIHDELSFLLLEGVIAERSEDGSSDNDTETGAVYRAMLRNFLKWPLSKIRTEQFMDALPPSFLQEKALVLGRVNRHEDALRILYNDLDSLDLALEYCDDRHSRQKALQEQGRLKRDQGMGLYVETDPAGSIDLGSEDNAYLPLIRVALESKDTERGTATAIKVLALRRSAIDRAAALRLLPSEVPVSAVARPFLIPALVDSESQVRRMTVVSALLRSRYLRLKDKLTKAQLIAQANIHVVPELRTLKLGDPLHSTKSFRARTTNPNPGSTMPYVEIVKHFFPRHLVIQAKITNAPYSSSSQSSASLYTASMDMQQSVLSDIAFVVAESSEVEAIQPMMQVPIQLLPPKMTGSAWCVLAASPGLMDGPTAQLTCELRYSVLPSVGDGSMVPGRTTLNARAFVEELHDLEVHASHF